MMACYNPTSKPRKKSAYKDSAKLSPLNVTSPLTLADKEQASPSMGVVGLLNLGNTSHLNAALQVLLACAPLQERLVHRTQLKRGPLGFSLQQAFMHVHNPPLFSINRGERPYNPSALRSAIDRGLTRLKASPVNNSCELLCALLEGLHDEEKRFRDVACKMAPTQGPESNVGNAQASEVYKLSYLDNCQSLQKFSCGSPCLLEERSLQQDADPKTMVEQLFIGRLGCNTTCTTCGHETVAFLPYLDLALDVCEMAWASVGHAPCRESSQIFYGDHLPSHSHTDKTFNLGECAVLPLEELLSNFFRKQQRPCICRAEQQHAQRTADTGLQAEDSPSTNSLKKQVSWSLSSPEVILVPGSVEQRGTDLDKAMKGAAAFCRPITLGGCSYLVTAQLLLASQQVLSVRLVRNTCTSPTTKSPCWTSAPKSSEWPERMHVMDVELGLDVLGAQHGVGSTPQESLKACAQVIIDCVATLASTEGREGMQELLQAGVRYLAPPPPPPASHNSELDGGCRVSRHAHSGWRVQGQLPDSPGDYWEYPFDHDFDQVGREFDQDSEEFEQDSRECNQESGDGPGAKDAVGHHLRAAGAQAVPAVGVAAGEIADGMMDDSLFEMDDVHGEESGTRLHSAPAAFVSGQAEGGEPERCQMLGVIAHAARGSSSISTRASITGSVQHLRTASSVRWAHGGHQGAGVVLFMKGRKNVKLSMEAERHRKGDVPLLLTADELARRLARTGLGAGAGRVHGRMGLPASKQIPQHSASELEGITPSVQEHSSNQLHSNNQRQRDNQQHSNQHSNQQSNQQSGKHARYSPVAASGWKPTACTLNFDQAAGQAHLLQGSSMLSMQEPSSFARRCQEGIESLSGVDEDVVQGGSWNSSMDDDDPLACGHIVYEYCCNERHTQEQSVQQQGIWQQVAGEFCMLEAHSNITFKSGMASESSISTFPGSLAHGTQVQAGGTQQAQAACRSSSSGTALIQAPLLSGRTPTVLPGSLPPAASVLPPSNMLPAATTLPAAAALLAGGAIKACPEAVHAVASRQLNQGYVAGKGDSSDAETRDLCGEWPCCNDVARGISNQDGASWQALPFHNYRQQVQDTWKQPSQEQQHKQQPKKLAKLWNNASGSCYTACTTYANRATGLVHTNQVTRATHANNVPYTTHVTGYVHQPANISTANAWHPNPDLLLALPQPADNITPTALYPDSCLHLPLHQPANNLMPTAVCPHPCLPLACLSWPASSPLQTTGETLNPLQLLPLQSSSSTSSSSSRLWKSYSMFTPRPVCNPVTPVALASTSPATPPALKKPSPDLKFLRLADRQCYVHTPPPVLLIRLKGHKPRNTATHATLTHTTPIHSTPTHRTPNHTTPVVATPNHATPTHTAATRSLTAPAAPTSTAPAAPAAAGASTHPPSMNAPDPKPGPMHTVAATEAPLSTSESDAAQVSCWVTFPERLDLGRWGPTYQRPSAVLDSSPEEGLRSWTSSITDWQEWDSRLEALREPTAASWQYVLTGVIDQTEEDLDQQGEWGAFVKKAVKGWHGAGERGCDDPLAPLHGQGKHGRHGGKGMDDLVRPSVTGKEKCGEADWGKGEHGGQGGSVGGANRCGWYRVKDSDVHPVTWERVVACHAKMLVYTRVDVAVPEMA